MQPASISGPKLASGPVKGLKLANVSVPVYVFGVALWVVLPQAATSRAARTAIETPALRCASRSPIP